MRTLALAFGAAALLCGVAALSHSQEGSNLGPVYPEGWRMVDRFSGFRFQCTRSECALAPRRRVVAVLQRLSFPLRVL
jgi:hypothetical protein